MWFILISWKLSTCARLMCSSIHCETVGVKRKVGRCIASFLDPSVRKQAVGVDGSISYLASVISWVPPGTVLGPCLFLVHIMCMSSTLSPGTYSLSFADDTRIWRGVSSREDCSTLQNDLQSVYSWAEHIKMTFNSGNLSGSGKKDPQSDNRVWVPSHKNMGYMFPTGRN